MNEEKTITINGRKVPEPVREPLEVGQRYWVVDPASDSPGLHYWEGDHFDYRWLDRGMIHLNEDAAEAHTDAIYRANKGETG